MKSTSTFTNRLNALYDKMQREGCDACLIQNPIDLLYLTGIPLSAGKLCIQKQKAMLFVDGRYLQVAQEKAPMPVQPDKKEAVSSFFERDPDLSVWIDGVHTSYDAYIKLHKEIPVLARSAFFKTLRVLKDAEEITKMQKSAHLLWKGFEFLRSQLREGVTEKDLARCFEIFCLEHGGEGLAFEPIIAFGPNTAMPHYRAGNASLKKNSIVLIDIGVVVDQYHSDMTRVLFFEQPDPELEKLYQINKRAHDAALALCLPGTKIGALDQAARAVMCEEGVEHLFVHSLGHGIGLETHEYPRISCEGDDKDVTLEPGMVFTIEPGLYLSGIGGVRHENTIVITHDGHTNLY